MRSYLLTWMLFLLCSQLSGQIRDSAYDQRVNERLKHTMEYFSTHVSNDTAILDTVAYVKRVYSNHIEKIHAITTPEANREPMYSYALRLHHQRLSDVLSQEMLKLYQDSFSKNISGFTFCPVCRYKYVQGRKYCGHCGEPLAGP